MINFDIEKKGYNKEQVSKYFERVQEEYEEVYSENQTLRSQLQQVQQQLAREQSKVYYIPPEQMEAIALALIDAETEAKRIVTTAREKAWQIITDAKKGLPVADEPAQPSLPANSVKNEQAAVPQSQKPAVALEPKSTMDDIDKLIESILGESRLDGD